MDEKVDSRKDYYYNIVKSFAESGLSSKIMPVSAKNMEGLEATSFASTALMDLARSSCSFIFSPMSPMKIMVEEKGTARGMGYMFSTADLNNGVILSSYKKVLPFSPQPHKIP